MAGAVEQDQLQRELQQADGAERMAEAKKKISFGQLRDDLHPLVADWKPLATQLKISAAEQNAIEGRSNMCQNCLQRVVEEWLAEEGLHTKTRLVEALKTKALGKNSLAAKISEDPEIPEDFDADTEESMMVLSEKLSEIAHKYKDLGIQLLDDHQIIDQIEHQVRDVQNYLNQVLQKWMDRQTEDTLPLSEILDAIRRIKKTRLAGKLKEKWTKEGLLTTDYPGIN